MNNIPNNNETENENGNDTNKYNYPKGVERANIKYIKIDGKLSYNKFYQDSIRNYMNINLNIPDGLYYDREYGILRRPHYPNIRANIREKFPSRGIPLILALTDDNLGLVFFTPIEIDSKGLENGRIQLNEELKRLFSESDEHSRIFNQEILETLESDYNGHPIIRVNPLISRVTDIRTGQLLDYCLLDHIITRTYNYYIGIQEMANANISEDSRMIPFYYKDSGVLAGFVSYNVTNYQLDPEYTYDDVLIYRFFVYPFPQNEKKQIELVTKTLILADEPEESKSAEIIKNYSEIRTFENISKEGSIIRYLRTKEGVHTKKYKPPFPPVLYDNRRNNNEIIRGKRLKYNYGFGPSRGNNGAGPSRGHNGAGPSRGNNIAGPSRGNNGDDQSRKKKYPIQEQTKERVE